MKNSASGPKNTASPMPDRLHVGFGLLGGRARVAVVGLAGRGFDDVADDDQAGLGRERVHHRRVRVQHQDHVGLVDRLPAGDRGAVEHDAVAEHVLIDGGDVLRGVLPLAARIGEPQVHVFHGVLLEHLQHFAHAAGGACRLSRHILLSRPLTSCQEAGATRAVRAGHERWLEPRRCAMRPRLPVEGPVRWFRRGPAAAYGLLTSGGHAVRDVRRPV